MDLMTIGGLVGGILVLFLGAQGGGSLSAFVNMHGILIVCGGTLCATMINCSARELIWTLRAGIGLFSSVRFKQAEETIPILVDLCRRARQGGVRTIEKAGEALDTDGFASRAIDACLILNDERLAREAIVRELNQVRARHREVGNIFRVMGLLAPMFGLLGTLIGIISVLRNLSDAAQAGPAMAVAISSAFYGICIANLVCVPAANKLRSRSMAEILSKEVVMTGVVTIVFSQRSPLALEAGLSGFLESPQREGLGEAAGAAAETA